jgi:trans-aconitate 2-methyltransferase
MVWDPVQYGRFARERGRPFVELLGRVELESPRRVVDLGCGSGKLTALLADRWPAATIEGIDSSPEMISAASSGAGVTFRVGDIRSFRPEPDTDLLISNAAFQWVPGHVDLLRSWASELPAGAWLAWQVPGNLDSPGHSVLRELASTARWSPSVGSVVLRPDAVRSPASYAALLIDCGLVPDVWETTYVHVLAGADPVLEWVRGTALRPVLAALSPDEVTDFEAEYAQLLRAAYPAGRGGTLYPFRRIFCVGRKA